MKFALTLQALVTEMTTRAASMRDFTHVLETEVVPVLQSQGNVFQELQAASRQMFKTMAET